MENTQEVLICHCHHHCCNSGGYKIGCYSFHLLCCWHKSYYNVEPNSYYVLYLRGIHIYTLFTKQKEFGCMNDPAFWGHLPNNCLSLNPCLRVSF